MPNLLTVGDAAKLLDCGPDNVRHLARIGVLKYETTAGGVRLFKRKEVERIAAKRKAEQARKNK